MSPILAGSENLPPNSINDPDWFIRDSRPNTGKDRSPAWASKASKQASKQASKHPWNRNGVLMRNENSKSSQVGDPQIHTRRHKPHTNKKENRKEIGRIRTCQIGSYSLPVNMLRSRARWVRFESWPSAAGISPTSRPHHSDRKACKTLAQQKTKSGEKKLQLTTQHITAERKSRQIDELC